MCFDIERQITLDTFVKNIQNKSKLKKTKTVVEWIVLDMQPFKVVEGIAFHNRISILDPQYQISGRGTIKNIIIKE